MSNVAWEYQIVVLPLSGKGGVDESRAVLNGEGFDGWDLVSVVPKMGSNPSLDCLAVMNRQKL